jgi:hypothetical protein
VGSQARNADQCHNRIFAFYSPLGKRKEAIGFQLLALNALERYARSAQNACEQTKGFIGVYPRSSAAMICFFTAPWYATSLIR